MKLKSKLVLLAVLALLLILAGVWPPLVETPIALMVTGAAAALGAIPGPVLLLAVLAIGWHLNRSHPPATPAT